MGPAAGFHSLQMLTPTPTVLPTALASRGTQVCGDLKAAQQDDRSSWIFSLDLNRGARSLTDFIFYCIQLFSPPPLT